MNVYHRRWERSEIAVLTFVWTHIYKYAHICINKPYWQSGWIITLEAGNIAIPDAQTASRISFYWCSVWHYQNLIIYRGAKIKLYKNGARKSFGWVTSHFLAEIPHPYVIFCNFLVNPSPLSTLIDFFICVVSFCPAK